MSELSISLIAFVCIFGGALLGLLVREFLPEHHLSDESKDAVKLGAGTIATMAALVLGLLIASAKGSFDTMNNGLRQMGSRVILLDRAMTHYGPETMEARQLLRNAVASSIERIWPEDQARPAIAMERDGWVDIETVQDKLRQLSPRNDAQRWLQSRALQISGDIAEGRWLLIEQMVQRSIPMPFLIILVSWLAIIFISFGLVSPRNSTVIVILFVCALSTAGAFFLILELDSPYEGLLKVSSAPLQNALAHLGGIAHGKP
jgi:hypothetical protein